ncbi:MAG TPA: hypothetical protein VGB63_09745 [Pedobacter sp.]
MKAKTNNEYLEKLKFVYESGSQRALNRRSKLVGQIKVPFYGSKDYLINKSKIAKVCIHHTGKKEYQFSYEEQIALTGTYTQSATFISALEKWQNCISEAYQVPFIHLVKQTKDSVFVNFKVISLDFENSTGKVKITNIKGVNLNIAGSTIPPDSLITYDSTYTLRFARLTADEALVSIDLNDGFIHSKHIPAFVSTPMFETQNEYGKLDFEIESNIYPNWLKVRNPNGTLQTTFELPNEDNDYHINFNVKTGLSNSDSKITDYKYINKSGGIRTEKKLGIRIEQDNTLSIDYNIVTAHGPTTGKFTVLYITSKKVCVANCP